MESHRFQTGSHLNRKPVEDPSNIPSENAVAAFWILSTVKDGIFGIVILLFLSQVAFPWVLDALEIIYG